MAAKKAARTKKRATKLVTKTSVATFVGLGLLTASAAAAAFGFASFSMSALRPAVAIRTNAATPAAAIVLDNQTNIEIARFDVVAGKEALLVERFGFLNCIARNDADGDCVDRGEVTANLAQASVITVSYTDITGATVTSSTRPVADRVDFAGQTLYVPARGTGTIRVYADTTAIDDAGVFSGDRFQVNFNAATATFRAIGQTTTRVYEETDINRSVMSSTMVLRHTEPTVSLSSSSPSGAVVPGVIETLRFNVSAASAEDVEVNRTTFRVSASDNAGSGWADCDDLGDTTLFDLYNLTDDPSTPITATVRVYDVSGTSCTSSTDRVGFVEFLINETVPAGATSTYALKIDTTGASAADDDLLAVRILTHVDMRTTGLDPLTWQDGTARGTAISGSYVNNLPITGGTLSF